MIPRIYCKNTFVSTYFYHVIAQKRKYECSYWETKSWSEFSDKFPQFQPHPPLRVESIFVCYRHLFHLHLKQWNKVACAHFFMFLSTCEKFCAQVIPVFGYFSISFLQMTKSFLRQSNFLMVDCPCRLRYMFLSLLWATLWTEMKK